MPRKSDSPVAMVRLVQLSHCSGGGHHGVEGFHGCICPQALLAFDFKVVCKFDVGIKTLTSSQALSAVVFDLFVSSTLR